VRSPAADIDPTKSGNFQRENQKIAEPKRPHLERDDAPPGPAPLPARNRDPAKSGTFRRQN